MWIEIPDDIARSLAEARDAYTAALVEPGAHSEDLARRAAWWRTAAAAARTLATAYERLEVEVWLGGPLTSAVGAAVSRFTDSADVDDGIALDYEQRAQGRFQDVGDGDS